MEPLEIAAKWLQGEIDDVHRARPMLRETPSEFAERLAHETEVRPTVDAACRYWIANRLWPRFGPELALSVWERVSHAHFLASGLMANGFYQNGTLVEVLEFLMIGSWPEFGIPRLREKL